LRLLATLREVDLIVAEDTRHTQRLLARHEFKRRSPRATSTRTLIKFAPWRSV
jgi:16S rRNA C1402 (ribose-2'-O) methylase RsmI